MVLPEGVLNNKNLAAVREYFEGRAKLILICSIPQDVFVAAGAMVKPSLVFMRKFTFEEETEYKKCRKEAIDEITALHQPEIDLLNSAIADCDIMAAHLKEKFRSARDKLKVAKKDKHDISAIEAEIEKLQQGQRDNRNKKKNVKNALRELYKQIEEEAKPVVKNKFDYAIPVAKIEDAGITTTGAASEGNQLPELVEEYRKYNKKHKLWISPVKNHSYGLNANGVYCRFTDGGEVHEL